MTYKKLYIWVLVIFASLLPVLAYSDEVRLVHFDYDYIDRANAASYRLYKDGVIVCENFNTDVMSHECEVLLSQTPAAFTFTAVRLDGVETTPSSPIFFGLPLQLQDEFGNYLPTISLQADVLSGTTPLTVNFDASLSDDLDGSIVDYQWDFADGTVGSGVSTSHIFDSPGLYDVALTIIDNSGGSTSAFETITVTEDSTSTTNLMPIASISAIESVELPSGAIDFNALGSSDPDGTIQTYSWDFGDGSTGSGISIVHEYVTAGDYTVTLSVIDDEGGFSFDQIIISIIDDPSMANEPPEPVIAASVVQRQIHFEWDYTPVDQIPAGFRLYQNNNLVCEVEGADIRQIDCSVYVEEGVVELFMTAYYQDQTETTISNVFTFDSTGIVPAVNEGNAPLTVQLNGNLSYDSDGYITSSEWDFGDGHTASGSVVQHTFTIGGLYTVTLSTTDNLGAVAQTSTTIHVVSSGIAGTTGGPTPTNIPPIAVNDIAQVEESSTVFIDVLSNDYDPEGSTLAITSINKPTNGTAVINNGKIEYTPTIGFFGTDSISYEIVDGKGGTATAEVRVTITRLQYAVTLNWEYSDEAGQVGFKLYYNGSSVCETTNPAARQMTCLVPANNDPKSFWLTAILEGSIESQVSNTLFYNPAEILIPSNTPPGAADISFDTAEDTPVVISPSSSDPDGDALTYSIVSPPTKGVVSIADASAGTFTYTPNSNENGEDFFSYKVNDGELDSNVATCTVSILSVNDAPVATDAVLSTDEDTAASGEMTGIDAEGDTLTFTVVTPPAKGVVSITNANAGTFTYTPNKNENGTDSFFYKVSDGTSESEVAMLSISIDPVNDTPVALDDSAIGEENTSLIIDVLANDFDTDNSILTLSSLTPPAHGDAAIKNGKIEYVPVAGFFGTDSISYSIDDGNGGTANAIVSITITQQQYAVTLTWEYPDEVGLIGFKMYYNGASVCETSDPLARQMTCLVPDTKDPKSFNLTSILTGNMESKKSNTLFYDPTQNNAPSAGDDALTIRGSESIVIDVLENDNDIDGDELVIDSVSSVINGSVVNNGNNITFIPSSGYVGIESFKYTINDGNGGIATGIVAVTVTAVQKEITFSWDHQKDVNIDGFRLYLNNSPICETKDPAARKLTCFVDPVMGSIDFILKSIELSGTESGTSNTIKYML